MESNTNTSGQTPDGRLIMQDRAKELMDIYFEKIHGGQAPKDIYGYVFSLESLKALMNTIERQNAAEGHTRVYGVRIYESFDPRPRPGKPEGVKSALLIPVDEKLNDLLKINKFAAGSSILEGEVIEPIIDVEPRPCPTMCSIDVG